MLQRRGFSFARTVWFFVLFSGAALGEAPAPATPSLRCEVGPVVKTYGMTQWLVYSCDDDRSVVLVSAPESPAMPFVFSFMFRAGSFQLHGEGAGSKEATAAAFNELKVFTPKDIAELVEQTKLQRGSSR